jgi:hypothetical protein
MKIQPVLEAIPMSHDPRHADSREALPALQSFQAGYAAADRRHDHILRTALLTAGCATLEPNKH